MPLGLDVVGWDQSVVRGGLSWSYVGRSWSYVGPCWGYVGPSLGYGLVVSGGLCCRVCAVGFVLGGLGLVGRGLRSQVVLGGLG